ncbi:MAG TPA: class I SAM-dependent methyltransferase [Solirubrobacteraceae bacterium]|jgi:tRNA (cmo5U34)-methyltransferase|nr:class I SAM-dependent methyltransferase [Solirubrobacteraceae bacterium]
MHDEAVAHFDSVSAKYGPAARRRIVPNFDAFYDSAIDALGLAGREIRRVLDLGAGTGLLSAHVAAAYPDTQLTLLDGAQSMLDRARENFAERASYVLADLADPLPGSAWDAIVSSLAIHHLDDAGKRDLFARIHPALAPGGVFVNAEQVAGPTGPFEDAYERWHEREAKRLGTTEAEWQQAVESMRHDRTACVEQQLEWLRDAGFADVDCLWKNHRLAVLVARRAG